MRPLLIVHEMILSGDDLNQIIRESREAGEDVVIRFCEIVNHNEVTERPGPGQTIEAHHNVVVKRDEGTL